MKPEEATNLKKAFSEIIDNLVEKPEEDDYKSIDTIEKVYEKCGVKNTSSWIRTILPDHMVAYWQLTLIAEAINPEGWVAYFTDPNQKKWFPYPEVAPSGRGFSVPDYDFDVTHTSIGSKLLFADENRAKHAFETFPEIYERFLNAK